MENQLNLRAFFKAVNPSKVFDLDSPEERKYFIDLSVPQTDILLDLKRTILSGTSDRPTCQLFAGQIGCGKTSVLKRLQLELEQQEFQAIYCDVCQDLEMCHL